VDADRFAAAMTESRRLISTSIPGSRLLRKDGAAAIITGIPFAGRNGVWLERPNPPVSSVASLLDEISAAGVPFFFQIRPGSHAALADIASSRGMRLDRELTLMAVDGVAGAQAVSQVPGLSIRQIGPDEAQVNTRLMSVAFAAPEESVPYNVPEELALRTAEMLRVDGVRCYVGEMDGRPVATAVGVTGGEFTEIGNVATDPAFRHRGFGSALAARAVTDGVRAGAAWCWLQASTDGYSIYQRLGFQTIETCSRWESGS
jgi:ribosomal protein S18 acetylase RimI-like enzyme